MERITRQLRGAVPNSVQLNGDSSCISFLPLASGGYYLSPVPDLANGAAASNTVDTSDYRVDFGTARFAIIGALNADDIYLGSASAALNSAIAEGASSNGLALAAAVQWQRNSVNQRFFSGRQPTGFLYHRGQSALCSRQQSEPGTGGHRGVDGATGIRRICITGGHRVSQYHCRYRPELHRGRRNR